MEAPEKNLHAVLLGRSGGFARAKKLSAQERRRIATIASHAARAARLKRGGKRSKSAA